MNLMDMICFMLIAATRGGGVAVYVKNSLAYKVIDKMCTEINVLEFVSIEICVKNKKSVTVL